MLDTPSPTLGTIAANCADILNDPAALGPPPTVGIPLGLLGLMPNDCIDAISDGNDPIDTTIHGTKSHLFSVSRASIGAGGSGVAAERAADTPGPGGIAGHPADLFLWSFPGPGNILAPAPDGWTAGAGATKGDEARCGLVTAVTIAPGDDVRGYEVSTLTWGGPGVPPFEVYFSLTAGSPTLGIIGATAADILVIGGPSFPGPLPAIFRTGVSIGIPVGADMDALSLEVNPGSPPTLHQVEYSISSAALFAFPFDSGATIILFDGAATVLGHSPAGLGLDVDDDLVALESVLPPPPPAPACCFPNGSCGDLPQADCVAFGGVSQPGQTCAMFQCPPPPPAESCCLGNGNCLDLAPADCAQAGGTSGGAGATCIGTNCELTQACCFASGNCVDVLPSFCGNALLGTPQGGGTTCASVSCEQACCFRDGSCSDLPATDCRNLSGNPQGFGTNCASTNCPQLLIGACCRNDSLGTCVDVTELECDALGGSFQGVGTDCSTTSCPIFCTCPADMNFDNVLNGLDVQLFVDEVLGPGVCSAPPSPANDDCANAYPIGDVTNLAFDTTYATFDGPGLCQLAPNVWFCYTATCTGTATAETCGSTYDTMIAVYDTCIPGPILGCNNNSTCGLTSVISFPVIAGNLYKIEVGGFGGATGPGDLTVVCQ